MSTPRSMDIAVTARCNLRCAYCSHFSSAGDVKEELATADWLQFFEELGRCGVMTVVLQGGEPFCRSDLPDLIRGIVANRMRFSILSNGTLITEELAALLSTSGRCEGVQVSLDGSVSEVHDAFRGAGSFAAALAGIRRLQRNEVPVTVRATLHRHNIDDLQSLAQLLLEDLGIPEFSTNAAAFMGLCRRNSEAVQLTVAERSRAMQTLLNLSQKYPGRISANAGPLADARRWSLMEQARRGGRETLPGGGYLTGCNCTATTLAARADGTLVPCLQMGHLALGRLDRDRLPVLWQHHPVLNTLRNRHRISLENFRDCFDCPYRSFCTGNCPALAHQITGDIERPSPDACLRLFLDQGGVLPESAAPDS
jgi:SynChlorMet cassette radical SAM/SPASM protein ScmE